MATLRGPATILSPLRFCLWSITFVWSSGSLRSILLRLLVDHESLIRLWRRLDPSLVIHSKSSIDIRASRLLQWMDASEKEVPHQRPPMLSCLTRGSLWARIVGKQGNIGHPLVGAEVAIEL